MKKHEATCPPSPVPVDEGSRLAALCRLDLLDSPADEDFDRLTRLAARLLAVPIALVSLVDQTRQWFKSAVGLEARQTSREDSFCAHAVFHCSPLVVNDARLDNRFAANPLVTGSPHIRAYLGVPILTVDGQPIGTLCAIDTEPRTFAPADIEALSDCAKLVEALVHDRERALETANRATTAIRDATAFSETFRLAQVGIVHTAMSGTPLRANPYALRLLGYSLDELRKTTFIDITHPDDVATNVGLFLQMASGEINCYRMEKRFLRGDGEYLWCTLAVDMVYDAAGSPDYMIAVFEDLSEKKAALESLSREKLALEAAAADRARALQSTGESMMASMRKVVASEKRHRDIERRVRMITDNIPGMVGYWTSEMVCGFANEPYRDWFGLPPNKIIGLTMRQLMGPELFALNEPHVQAALRGEGQHFTRRLVKPDGTVTFTDARYVPDRDERGAVIGFYVLVTDMTALHAAREELEGINLRLAKETVTDHLTGLSNRRAFTQACAAASEHAKTEGRSPGLVLVDLDDFKRINDEFGHDGGDEVLRAVGEVLRNQLRNENDLAARLGGEEFAMLCVDLPDASTLVAVAERIREKLEKLLIRVEKGTIRVTGSFGVAHAQGPQADWKAMYKQADRALYRAKEEGKNCVRVNGAIRTSSGAALYQVPNVAT